MFFYLRFDLETKIVYQQIKVVFEYFWLEITNSVLPFRAPGVKTEHAVFKDSYYNDITK